MLDLAEISLTLKAEELFLLLPSLVRAYLDGSQSINPDLDDAKRLLYNIIQYVEKAHLAHQPTEWVDERYRNGNEWDWRREEKPRVLSKAPYFTDSQVLLELARINYYESNPNFKKYAESAITGYVYPNESASID